MQYVILISPIQPLMPKIPKSEWGDFGTDPESEEHAPTKSELTSDRENEIAIRDELGDIEYQLASPETDPYTGEKTKFNATDPDIFWTRLAYVRTDCLNRIRDPEVRKNLEDRISQTENHVYRQYIPFIRSRIYIYGWQNSPLEKYTPEYKMSSDEAQHYFNQAHAVLEHFDLSDDEKIDFITELDRLQEQLDRYRSEPTLFTFEKLEEELQSEMFEMGFGGYNARNNHTAKALYDEDAQKQAVLKYEGFIEKSQILQNIADGMVNEDIRTRCTTRAESLREHAEYLKARNESPREVLMMEGELRDMLYKIKNGGSVDSRVLDELADRLSKMKDMPMDSEYVKVFDGLTRLYEKIKRVLSGESISEDDERFDIRTGDIDWAWSILGVDRDASHEKVRSAYRQLARKYHPDFNQQKGSKEKMQKLGDAYEFIQRTNGYM